jgi:hypothetical protein
MIIVIISSSSSNIQRFPDKMAKIRECPVGDLLNTFLEREDEKKRERK